jgi:hypothetical protein
LQGTSSAVVTFTVSNTLRFQPGLIRLSLLLLLGTGLLLRSYQAAQAVDPGFRAACYLDLHDHLPEELLCERELLICRLGGAT